jgi:exodeoxyribonuclease-3
MKHFIVFSLFLFAVNISAQAQEELKVISYNIWNGFDWGNDTLRQEKVSDWIIKEEADVVALQELCKFSEEKLAKLASSWGHNYSFLLKTSGYPVGITSKKPIVLKKKLFKNMHHGALHCETFGIDFFLIHFSPFSYKKRHKETRIVLSKLEKVRKQQNKYLVLGDFNAVSPFDAHLYKHRNELLTLMKESEEEHKHVRNLQNGSLEYGAISACLGFPLIDVVQKYTEGYEQRVSCPTRVFEEEMGAGIPPNSKRIDYIFASPFLGKNCTDARVANGIENHYLSDHYPVVARFNLSD